MSLSTYTLGNVVVRLQNPECVAVCIALGNPTRKRSEAATGATHVIQFPRPAAVPKKYLENPWQWFWKICAQQSVRDLAYGFFPCKAVHLFRSSIPSKDTIMIVTHKNGVVAQIEQPGLFSQMPLVDFALSNIASNLGSPDNLAVRVPYR